MSKIPFMMRACVLKHSASAAAVGVPGAFVAHGDIPVLVGIWTNMFYRLAKHADRGLDMKTAGRLAATMASALSVAALGTKAMTTAVAYSGIGTPFAIAANASANGGATYLIGMTASDLLIKDRLTALDLIQAVVAGLGLTLGNADIGRIIDGPSP